MRILFIGSYREPDADRQRFEEAARSLGKAAVELGHEVVIGSGDESTIDPHVARGVSEVPGNHRIFLVRKASSMEGLPELRQLSNLSLVERPYDVPWEAGRVYQLRECDVVVSLGGGGGTEVTGFMGPPLQKPVLAIPVFGRASKKLFDVFKSHYDRLDILLPLALEDWNDKSAVQSIRAAQKLLEANPYLSIPYWRLLMAMGAVVILIVLWLLAYLYGNTLRPPEAAVIVMLVISAALGALLRSSLRLFEGRGVEVTGRRLITELTVGVLISFGLMLVYLGSGILFQGDVTEITNESFKRASVATSLLALAAAFLLEESTTRLKTVLQNSLNSRGDGSTS